MKNSSNIPTSTRGLRSNTDKTQEDPPNVLAYPVEQGQKKKRRKSRHNSTDSTEYFEASDLDSTAQIEESKSPIDDKITEIPILKTTFKVIWEEFENELKVTEDLFFSSTVYPPFIPKVYRPTIITMAQKDSKDDLEDERDTLIDRVAAIQLTLNNHALVLPAIAIPMSKEMVEIKLEDLNAVKAIFDQIQLRTRRLFRSGTVADRDQAIALNNDVLQNWETAILHAHKIKLELQAQVISRVKIPRAEPPNFDGKSTNWPAFLDQFNSMVVNNIEVSSTDKLALLKKSLENGTAHHIVQNFPLTDIDWTNAWSAVKSRYNHEREIAYAHLSKLFDLTAITLQSQIGIRNIIDTVNEVIRALKNLNVETDKWDLIIIYIIRKNLDNRTRTDFEKSLPDDKMHSLKVLLDFLNNLAVALGTAGIVDRSPKPKDGKDTKSTTLTSEEATPSKGQISTEQIKKRNICVFCSHTHWNSKCQMLIPLTPKQRIKLTSEKKLCKNCLKKNHIAAVCRSPPCGVNGCQGKHNSLLHMDTIAESHTTTADQGKCENKKKQESLSASEDSEPNVLLSTAVVNIIVNNEPHKVRALIDQGSQVNLMTEKLANKLRLKRKASTVCINGIGNSKPNFAKGSTSIQIQSLIDTEYTTHITCYILPEVSGNKPSHRFNSTAIKQFKNLKLADETFNVPGPVDIILGAQVFLDILGNHHIKGHPTALDTKLGYIITGTIDSHQEESVFTLTCDVDFDLTRFWQQKEVPDEQRLSPEEKEAEDNFIHTYSQDDNGKFTVALPFTQEKKPLGESRNQAAKRLFQIERKLDKSPEKRILYQNAMKEYIEEGYVTEIPSLQLKKTCGETFYLPHHFVEKESSTTKFRVVFDGSAKTTTGFSLNDNLLVGPCIQNDLLKIRLRFREHNIVFSADIRKMYLQIGVQKSDQDYLRFLWRHEKTEPIKEYKYNVIPFGLSSSPFLAIRTLHQLANNLKVNYPIGVEALFNDFYVDDCLSGADTVRAALEKQSQLQQLLSSGQFQLRK